MSWAYLHLKESTCIWAFLLSLRVRGHGSSTETKPATVHRGKARLIYPTPMTLFMGILQAVSESVSMWVAHIQQQ